MWTKDANPFGKLNWHDAMARCSSFSISGIGGWRLPSKLMGHKTMVMTQRYSHLVPGAAQKAVQRLEAAAKAAKTAGKVIPFDQSKAAEDGE
ncbi:hypothetical protein [Desulfonatronum parangueonense]